MIDPFGEREGAAKPQPPFPSPFAALMLTFAASLAAFVIAVTLFEEPGVAALGIGEALGVGGVATLAARRVPEPQFARLGLRGFSPRLLPLLLCLVPLVFLVSELDNWGRDLDARLPTLVPEEALVSALPGDAEQVEADASDATRPAPEGAAQPADEAGVEAAARAEHADDDAAGTTAEGADDAASVAGAEHGGAAASGDGADEPGDQSEQPREVPQGWELAEIAIVSVGIAPVVEGFLFFGVILQGLVSVLGRRRGLLLTGCLYAMIHMVGQVGLDAGPARSLAGLVSLVAMGATLGLCRLATGSVLAPIVLSTGFIGLQLLAVVAPDVIAVPGYNVDLDAHTPLSVLVPAVASVAFGAWWLSRQPGEVLPRS